MSLKCFTSDPERVLHLPYKNRGLNSNILPVFAQNIMNQQTQLRIFFYFCSFPAACRYLQAFSPLSSHPPCHSLSLSFSSFHARMKWKSASLPLQAMGAGGDVIKSVGPTFTLLPSSIPIQRSSIPSSQKSPLQTIPSRLYGIGAEEEKSVRN